MLKYLIIPLTKDAVSFCHYEIGKHEDSVIDTSILREAIVFAMKENLNIQFLYPSYEISKEHKYIIASIDHTSIAPSTCNDIQLVNHADIIVFDSWTKLAQHAFNKDKNYVMRTNKNQFFDNMCSLKSILKEVDRLVMLFTDVEDFTNEDFEKYSKALNSLISVIIEEYKKGHIVHFSPITDRVFLNNMNNCNAGYESITLAPDGKFYICPAFYIEGNPPIGDICKGLNIKNSQLFRLTNAPICRICDAYQCRRCVWLNKKTTGEVNTPSHEQCVVAHIERNASKRLLESIREIGNFLPGINICEINYLDPFDKLIK